MLRTFIHDLFSIELTYLCECSISSISVENAFYLDPRIKDAAVVPVPDEKLGELVGYVTAFSLHITLTLQVLI